MKSIDFYLNNLSIVKFSLLILDKKVTNIDIKVILAVVITVILAILALTYRFLTSLLEILNT